MGKKLLSERESYTEADAMFTAKFIDTYEMLKGGGGGEGIDTFRKTIFLATSSF